MLFSVKVKISNRHTTMEGDEGKTVKMSCEAKGYPLPVIQWYKDGKLINGIQYKIFTTYEFSP
jgi:hypothetical protein